MTNKQLSLRNSVDVLINGTEIFPAMLKAIEQSKYEICFETFVYWSGSTAENFAIALANSARRGVRVYVMLDWWGSLKMDKGLVELMGTAGVKVRYFNPLKWWHIRRLNYRTHRKIMVVDRQVAFTGGVGIADVWQGNARSPKEWHDLHYKVRGPVVAKFMEAFIEVWVEVLQEQYPAFQATSSIGEDKQNTCSETTSSNFQIITSSPRKGSECVYSLYNKAIKSAQRSVQLTTAYFVPNQEMISLIKASVQRGVKFEVMVPGKHTDSDAVKFASMSSWGSLLRAGVEFYLYDPTMLHAKYLIIDGEWLIVGSPNFDNRSFTLNDEITLSIFDRKICQHHLEIFLYDRGRCRQMSYPEWKSRSVWCRSREWIANLLRRQL